MKKNLSRKADNSSACQEIGRILRNPTDHHCVRKHMPFILGQMNPVGALLPYYDALIPYYGALLPYYGALTLQRRTPTLLQAKPNQSVNGDVALRCLPVC